MPLDAAKANVTVAFFHQYPIGEFGMFGKLRLYALSRMKMIPAEDRRRGVASSDGNDCAATESAAAG
jgi:hypothetical protein